MVNASDKEGWTALHYSVYKGNLMNTLRQLYIKLITCFDLQDLRNTSVYCSNTMQMHRNGIRKEIPHTKLRKNA